MSLTLEDLSVCTSERSRYHYISANDGYHSATCTSTMTCTTSYRCAYHQQKTPSSQVTGVETLRNTNFADMTLKAGHRTNKGHGRYNLEIFREDANFQRLGTHNFVTISRIVRVLFSENPRRGCDNPRSNLRTPQANDTYLFKLWVYTLVRDCKVD